jgi:uncharacterized protein involved in exopolysaccharide biosynthesis
MILLGNVAIVGATAVGGGIAVKAAMKTTPAFVATIRGSVVYGPVKQLLHRIGLEWPRKNGHLVTPLE